MKYIKNFEKTDVQFLQINFDFLLLRQVKFWSCNKKVKKL